MVKRSLVLIGLCLLLSTCKQKSTAVATSSIVKNETLKIKEGYQLNYNLAAGGERYQFVVEIKELNPFVNFDYILTMKKKVIGNMTITEKAVNSATKMSNGFRAGTYVLADTVTTVWASKDMYRDIVRKGKCFIDDGGYHPEKKTAIEEYEYQGKREYTCLVNGVKKTFDVLWIVGKTGNQSEFWILDNPESPLIVRMKVSFEISLKEIFHPF